MAANRPGSGFRRFVGIGIIWTFWISPLVWNATAWTQDMAPWQLGMPQFNPDATAANTYTYNAALPAANTAANTSANTSANMSANMSGGTPSYQLPVDPASAALASAELAATVNGNDGVFQLPGYRMQDGDSATDIQLAAHAQQPMLDAPTTGTYPTLPIADPATSDIPPAIPGMDETLGSAIAQDIASEIPPLQQEVESWYMYPWRWMTQGWQNHAELGLDGSRGNAQTLAIQTGLEMKRKTDLYTLGIDIDYRFANTRNQVTNQEQTTEDNGRFNLDYDRLLNDSPWSAFGKFGMEFDQFKAFDLRLNLNAGVGYHWIRNDRTTLVTRFGSGASKEIGSPDDAWKPEAVFGLESEHQLNASNKLKAKVDYFPAWEDFSDYRLVTDLGWEILLNDSENLSLKLALTDRYDSTPQGAKPNDVYYSLLFLVKF
ncbi:DUF481 domain-containing protein [Stieleria varia]|uniref:Chromo domain-containing protein n=1 Tax=Stieleria varia TaxID=2528005 RepID=A0A5C6AGE0_9BACT|nr:DUF481 domain-containing protein [Stieleria varia]TWT98466.1 hypothetical protein Pla52n_49800 [Stieleria varia]